MFRRPGFSNLSFAAKVKGWSAMRSSLALPVPTTQEAAAFTHVDDGQRCRKKFADFKAEGSWCSAVNRSLAHSINPSDFASLLGAIPISTLHAFQRRLLSTGNCETRPMRAHQVADYIHEKRVEWEEKRKQLARLQRDFATLSEDLALLSKPLAELEVMQAELAELKKTLSTMLAVVSGKQVPEEEKGFAKYFTSIEPRLQHSSIKEKELDIKDKELDIRMQRKRIDAKAKELSISKERCRKAQAKIDATTRELEELQSENAVVTQLQEILKLRPRSIRRLTHSETFNKEFLGREVQLHRVMEVLNAKTESKEGRSPVLVYSAPRQGKSRLMDEIAKRGLAELGPDKLFVVVLSYNGVDDTSTGQADCTMENLAARFFCRMLLGSVSQYDAHSANDFAARFPFLRTLEAVDFDRILRKVHGLSDQRIWLLADEYAKCYLRAAGEAALLRNEIPNALKAQVTALYQFLEPNKPYKGNKIVFSGFTESASSLLKSVSDRPVVKIPLPLIDAKQRPQFQVMSSSLLNSYRVAKEPFPEMLYEVLKSCVGMMGYWIELCSQGSYPNRLCLMEVPWVDKLLERKGLYLQIAERYLHKWAVGSLDMESFLKEEAHNFDSSDAGPSIMFLPLSNRTVAHPVPFYALTYEFPQYFPDYAHKFTPLVTQLETVYTRIATFLADVEAARAWKQTDQEFKGKVSQARGLLVEEITYMVMGMHYHALASLTQPRPLGGCLTNWILWEGRDTESNPSKLTRIPKDVAIMPNPDIKSLSLTDVRRCSLENLFDGTSDGDPEAEAQGKQVATVLEKKSTKVQRTKEEIEREREEQVAAFYSEVSKYGVLMAPKKNSGFDLVASFPATKNGKEGIVLMLVETKCISDEMHAKNIARKYWNKIEVGTKPLQMTDAENEQPPDSKHLQMAAADRSEPLQDSQATPKSDRRAGDDNPTELAPQNCLHFKPLLMSPTPSVTSGELSSEQRDCLDFSATRKAWLSLHGVHLALPYFEKLSAPVIHVCFVYVSLGKFVPSFRTDTTYKVKRTDKDMSLDEVVADIGKQQVSVSLHVVAGQHGLEDFFTGAVYHAIPDGEFYLEPEKANRIKAFSGEPPISN